MGKGFYDFVIGSLGLVALRIWWCGSGDGLDERTEGEEKWGIE